MGDRQTLRHSRPDLLEGFAAARGWTRISGRRLRDGQRKRVGPRQQGRDPQQFGRQFGGRQPSDGIGRDGPLQHCLKRAESGDGYRVQASDIHGQVPGAGDRLTKDHGQIVYVLRLFNPGIARRRISRVDDACGRRGRSRIRGPGRARINSLGRPSSSLVEGRGQAEVRDVGPGTGVEQDGGGRQAEVCPAALVNVHERPGGLQPDHERLRRSEPVALAQERSQAAPGEILGHRVWLRIDAPVVHGQHARMAERRGGPHLIGEALREADVLGGVGSQDLQCNSPAQGEILSHVDASVRALSDELQQPVAAAECPPRLLVGDHRRHGTAQGATGRCSRSTHSGPVPCDLR